MMDPLLTKTSTANPYEWVTKDELELVRLQLRYEIQQYRLEFIKRLTLLTAIIGIVWLVQGIASLGEILDRIW